MLGRRQPEARALDPSTLIAGLAVAALALVASSPAVLPVINWDQADYIARCADGELTWSSPPWNAHFAIGQVYWLGCRGLLGTTAADAFRVVNAIAYGLAGAIVFALARRLSGSASLAAALCAAWATAWVNLVLVGTIEDNVLYLPIAAAVIAIAATRVDDWRRRDSLVIGAFCAVAALVSWQAIYYLGLAVWAALWAAPQRVELRRRFTEAGLVVGAFVATLLAWCVLVGATSHLSIAELIRSMCSRPTGSFRVRPPWRIVELLDTLGGSAAWMVRHEFFLPVAPVLPVPRVVAGALLLLAIVAAFALATVTSLRRRYAGPHVLAAAMLLFSVLTPMYVDVPFRYLIRFDFLPLLLAPLLAWALARHARVAVPGLITLIVLQLGLAWRWDRAFLSHRPTLASWVGELPNDAQYGREGRSYYAWFRDVRRTHPDACRYVLRLEELRFASWQLDALAALWSELPEHLLVGDPQAIAGWRHRPHVAPVGDPRLTEACAWLSPDAARLLRPR